MAVSAPVPGKELWNLHVDRLRLWLWLITRLTAVAALVGLLWLLRVVPTLTGWCTCEHTLISDIADVKIMSENCTRGRVILLLWLAVVIFVGHDANVRVERGVVR